jgi:YD repeat-containing protein
MRETLVFRTMGLKRQLHRGLRSGAGAGGGSTAGSMRRTFPASGYVVVSDGTAFVLVRETSSLRTAQGQTVTLVRDAQGRLVARIDHGRDIGS